MKEIQTFLVDFDTIFDTRLGTLLAQNQELAEKNLTIDYYKRKDDSFIDMPLEAFQKLYKKRDIEILKKSIKTPFVTMLFDFVKGTYQNSINGFEQKKPKILFNMYPYQVTKEDIEAIQQIFIDLTQGFCLLEFTSMSIEQMTPLFLREEVGAFSLYNYVDWLEFHAANDNLKKISIPSVSLFGPKIHFKKVTSEEKNFLLQTKIDPFDQIQKMTSPFVNLKLLDIIMYSADLLPKDLPNSKE